MPIPDPIPEFWELHRSREHEASPEPLLWKLRERENGISSAELLVARTKEEIRDTYIYNSKIAQWFPRNSIIDIENGFYIYRFPREQQIQQRNWEPSSVLHERLRWEVVSSMREITHPTKIRTPSWYSQDLWETTWLVAISTCKHESPNTIFLWKRKSDFQKDMWNWWFEYTLYPLWTVLSEAEKNAIYDKMF